MSRDRYRSAIFNAQVYANTGAGTYEKAVDMAVHDMLAAGLNCVVYSNGARHTLRDYASMAIRTANKRAYLMGAGEQRNRWGIHTVVVNNRRGGCRECAQYIGRVFIDDVYSGGTKADGDYPLLSDPIKNRLFHPNCKDSTSTYYEGITTLKPVTEEELREMDRREKLEQQQNYHEKQAERNDRLAKHSLDPDNRRKYAARATANREKAEEIEEKIEESIANSGEGGIIKAGGKITDSNYTQIEHYEEQAQRFYAARLKDDFDVQAISESTGFPFDDVLRIKNHIMREKHLFQDGTTRKFDADIDQALAWQRLMDNEARDTNLLLLNHELEELKYMQKFNCDYETAHAVATKKFDWQSAIELITDTDELKLRYLI